MPKDQIYWGETYDNVCQRPNCPVSMAQNVAYARDHLDFYAPAQYVSAHVELEARDGAMRQDKPATMVLEQWKDDETLAREWQELQEQTRAFYEPGAFVTFPGYEWQGDGRWGDHNVIFSEEGNAIVKVNTLPELYAGLRGLNAVAIPHHTAYIEGCRGKTGLCTTKRSPRSQRSTVFTAAAKRTRSAVGFASIRSWGLAYLAAATRMRWTAVFMWALSDRRTARGCSRGTTTGGVWPAWRRNSPARRCGMLS